MSAQLLAFTIVFFGTSIAVIAALWSVRDAMNKVAYEINRAAAELREIKSDLRRNLPR